MRLKMAKIKTEPMAKILSSFSETDFPFSLSFQTVFLSLSFKDDTLLLLLLLLRARTIPYSRKAEKMKKMQVSNQTSIAVTVVAEKKLGTIKN